LMPTNITNIFVSYSICLTKFMPGTKLVLLPTGIVYVFIKHNHSTGYNLIF
jgi:hypothetical protein